MLEKRQTVVVQAAEAGISVIASCDNRFVSVTPVIILRSVLGAKRSLVLS